MRGRSSENGLSINSAFPLTVRQWRPRLDSTLRPSAWRALGVPAGCSSVGGEVHRAIADSGPGLAYRRGEQAVVARPDMAAREERHRRSGAPPPGRRQLTCGLNRAAHCAQGYELVAGSGLDDATALETGSRRRRPRIARRPPAYLARRRARRCRHWTRSISISKRNWKAVGILAGGRAAQARCARSLGVGGPRSEAWRRSVPTQQRAKARLPGRGREAGPPRRRTPITATHWCRTHGL